jgi:aryl-alcohol dehydrogenase-like predicted oxidoreductase
LFFIVMQTHPLAKTGPLVTRLGLGLAALGRPGYINLGHAQDLGRSYDVAAMEAHAHCVLDAAWAAGIRYFDAARSYGRAEEFLAGWLKARKIPADQVAVGSKWGYTYTAGWKVEADRHEVKDHSLAVVRRQLGESRGLLGAQLDLYQIHSATLESGVLADRAVLEELARLRDGGLAVGLTLSGPRQADTLRQALGIEFGGKRVFSCVQATWNLLEPSVGPVLKEAHQAGVGVIVKEALANGRLTARNQMPEFAAKRRILEDVAGRCRATIDALALAAVLAQPWVDVVLSGAATVEQLQSNVRALDVRLDAEMLARLEEIREESESYWRTRGGLPWN